MKPIFALLLIAMLATACTTTRVQIQPGTDLSTQHPKIELDIHGDVSDPSLIPILVGDLEPRLANAGFSVVPDAPDAIRLDVEIDRFDPGNAFLRTVPVVNWTGLGKGSLVYTARFVDQSGTVLAEMAVKEIFTGYDLHLKDKYGAGYSTFAAGIILTPLFLIPPLLEDAGGVRKILTLEAAKRIVMLAKDELHPKPRPGRRPKR